MLYPGEQLEEEIFVMFEDFIETLDKGKNCNFLPQHMEISDIFCHGPATCFITNNTQHDQPFDIDITLGVQVMGEKMRDSLRKDRSFDLFHSFLDQLDDDAVQAKLHPSTTSYTWATIQDQLFLELEKISPNILTTCRLLKTFICLMFPKVINQNKQPSNDYEEKAFINSHEVTKAVIKYVSDHNAEDHWASENLAKILVDILNELFQTAKNRYQDYNLEFEESIVLYLKALLLGKQYRFLCCSNSLIDPFEETYAFLRKEQYTMCSSRDIFIKRLGKYHSGQFAYIKPSLPQKLKKNANFKMLQPPFGELYSELLASNDIVTDDRYDMHRMPGMDDCFKPDISKQE